MTNVGVEQGSEGLVCSSRGSRRPFGLSSLQQLRCPTSVAHHGAHCELAAASSSFLQSNVSSIR